MSTELLAWKEMREICWRRWQCNTIASVPAEGSKARSIVGEGQGILAVFSILRTCMLLGYPECDS